MPESAGDPKSGGNTLITSKSYARRVSLRAAGFSKAVEPSDGRTMQSDLVISRAQVYEYDLACGIAVSATIHFRSVEGEREDQCGQDSRDVSARACRSGDAQACATRRCAVRGESEWTGDDDQSESLEL